MQHQFAASYIKQGLGELCKRYLSIMELIDSEDLVTAFENIIVLFAEDIAPFALDICNHLKTRYINCISEKYKQGAVSDDNLEIVLTAVAALKMIRRILFFSHKDV